MSFSKVKLVKKELKYEDVVILEFSYIDKNKISFFPGQYANIFLSKNNLSRAYTIISDPNDKNIRFAVRKKGEVSTLLYNLKLKEKVDLDGPYGNFNPKNSKKNLVCIANGIGITPFISWIKSLNIKEKINIHFLFSSSTIVRAPFLDDLYKTTEHNKKIKFTLFITQENNLKDKKIIKHRITKRDINKIIEDKKNTTVAICGSVSFSRDMWKLVKSLGIKEENIITETFY